ncbi:MAG: MBOAT family O-acyltransferase [Planctomycetota bacterium]|nr:MBOAT family O-acyltransferase [Planctomycetota bacterium]
MLFNSLDFVLFFPLVVCGFFLMPQRFRWALLLAASYYFYMCWKAEYVLLIIASTLIDYVAGLRMGAHKERAGRRPWLILSLTCNLGLLFAFKYWDFFNDSTRYIFQQFNLLYEIPDFDLILPVGISFYTFQTLSYSIDVYRGEKDPERHLGIFALYVSFFPQLMAGPIERSATLLPQFRKVQQWDWMRIRDGLTQMLFGFFKKLVIADRLSLYVDEVYANSSEYHGLPMWVATYFFAIQVYCDFSGYSDIAIGGARVMGFKLMTNFRRPYLADSFKSFWERWHISLTTWFRDYVYFPMGGSRKGALRTRLNMLLLFTLCGLWHGARWNCVLWGTVNGVFLVMGQLTGGIQDRIAHLTGLARFPRIRKVWNVFMTFTLFVLSLMIWRSTTLPDMVFNLQQAFTAGNDPWLLTKPMAAYELAIALGSLALLLAYEICGEFKDSELIKELNARTAWIRWPVYYALFYGIVILGIFELKEFVYFQF